MIEVTPESLIETAEKLINGEIWVNNPLVAELAKDYLTSLRVLKILQSANKHIERVYKNDR